MQHSRKLEWTTLEEARWKTALAEEESLLRRPPSLWRRAAAWVFRKLRGF